MKFAAMLVLAFVVGCSSKTKPTQGSWGAQEYAAEGLVIDRPWTHEDHVRAATVLARVTEGHRERLPRFRDTKSGEVFAKLIGDLPDSSGLSPLDHLGVHGARFNATNAISKLYADNLLTPPREWIELMGACLREAPIMLADMEHVIAALGPDDPTRAAREDGRARMKLGFGGMMLGGVMVVDNKTVPEDDRIAMMRHITAALPTLLPAVSGEAQRTIRDYLQKLEAGLPDGKLREAVSAGNHALPPL